MVKPRLAFLGYDPGGNGENGVAVLFVPTRGTLDARVDTREDVAKSLEWFFETANGSKVIAAGIDTFLSWSTGRSGWRPMDDRLRKCYPKIITKSIISSNSAHGSMAVQGMAMAILLRQAIKKIGLNETHPKVLYHALRGPNHRYSFRENKASMNKWLIQELIGIPELEIKNDHEWDALISAWATWQGHAGKLTTDLMEDFKNPILPAGKVTYFWPSCPLST